MEAQSQADLATKRDRMELEMRLRTDLASGKYEIIKWVSACSSCKPASSRRW